MQRWELKLQRTEVCAEGRAGVGRGVGGWWRRDAVPAMAAGPAAMVV